MKTIQMEIDDALLKEVERATRATGITRSEFICDALRLILREPTITTLEKQHRDGYKKHPVAEGEFDGWEMDQVWGDK